MFDLIAHRLKAWYREFRDRQQLRDLLAKDDRVLEDIGLTRQDIEAALMKPFGVSGRNEAYRLSLLSLALDRKI